MGEGIKLFFSSLPSGSGFFNGKIFQLFPFLNRGNHIGAQQTHELKPGAGMPCGSGTIRSWRFQPDWKIFNRRRSGSTTTFERRMK
jgi:hypothetical protein